MWNRNLVILLGSQIIAVSGSVLIVTIGGLVGARAVAERVIRDVAVVDHGRGYRALRRFSPRC